MAMKKIILGTTVLAGLGTAAFCYDIQQKQIYTCQPFSEAISQYFTINAWRSKGSMYHKKLDAAAQDVCRVQEDFLMSRIRENECTEYGKLFNFANMKSVCDFKRCHPLTRYDHYQPWIERMLCGEGNVLTKECPMMYATTPGTCCGLPKVLPVVKAQHEMFINEGAAVCFNAMTECFNCSNRDKLYKAFYIYFNPCWKMCKAGVKMGPWAASQEEMKGMYHLFTSPEPLLNLRQEKEAMYVHMLFALHDCKLGMMASDYANTLFYAFKMLETERTKFICDITNGTLCQELDLRCDIRRCLEPLLKPNCDRGRMIDQAFACGLEGLALRIWPDLQLALCMDSGSFSMYGEALRKCFLRGVHVYSPLYFAAEGLLGVNVWPRNLPTRYLLNPRVMFFELIPVNCIKEEQPETILLQQAEVNQMYEVVITSVSGLYRYRMGDIVKVCGFHHEAPIVEFMYRDCQTLNMAGEEVTEHLFFHSLTSVTKEWSNFSMVDYVAVPSTIVKAVADECKDPKIKDKYSVDTVGYYLFVEPNMTSTIPSKEQLNMMDTCLKDRSPAYQMLRDKGALSEVQVQFVHPNTFNEVKDLMNQCNECTSGQYKVPRVLSHPDAVECLIRKAL